MARTPRTLSRILCMLFPRLPLLAAVAMTLALSACGKDDPTGVAPSTLAVTLATAEQRPIQRSVIASGPVSAFEEMQLGVEISGARVTALNVDVGQAVRKGQVLLELDHRTLDSELAQADAALREADASVALATSSFNRGSPLAKQQLISASALDELRANRAQAEARRSTVRAQRDAAQLRRDFAELRAPANGIISKRLVQPGQVVAAGTELLRLIRDGRLEWRAELPEDSLAQVAPGALVTLSGSDGSRIEGRIRAVSPGVDSETRTGTVYADLPEPGPLKSGTFLEGRIASGAGNALMVPVASVVQRDGHAYVFTVDKDIVARLRVRTGAVLEGRVEIIEGLKPGTRVVEQGAGFLGEGDRVRVVTANATGTAAPASPAP